MEEKKMPGVRRVGIGTILPLDSYKIEDEVLLLRVRLNGSAVQCLIDAERRVKEIIAAPEVEVKSRPMAPLGDVAFDASLDGRKDLGPENEAERLEYAEAVELIAGRFEVCVQRFAADSRACLRKMASILDRHNPNLTWEFRDGAAPALKGYLIRELFKRTVRMERGFKILLLLSHVIAANGGGQPERLEAMSLEDQKRLLREFMDFLKVVGHKRIDPRIFEEIYDKFNEQEYANLSRGGTGFFIKPLYVQEMQEMKAQVLNAGNSNYIEQLFSNSLRDPLDFLHENTLAYLKALAIVRLYAKSNRKERGGDSKIVEHFLSDLIRFRPAWVKSTGKAAALTA
jgi:hypothetical protein